MQQRGRLLILLGLFFFFAAVVIGVGYFLIINQPAAATPTPEGGTEAPPVDQTLIVIAVQDLPRGSEIPKDALGLQPWPTDKMPITAIVGDEGLASIVGKQARYDIKRGEPVLKTSIADGPSDLSAIGSEAALRIPKGLVAITVPLSRLSGVGYALQEGDHVNVLVSMLFVDVSEETQSITPGNASLFTNVTVDETTGTFTFTLAPVGAEGTVEVTEGQFPIPFFLQPSESQRPRLVAQQVVQNAIVLNVGNFNQEKIAVAQASPTPLPEGSPPPPPTPVPPPDIITLMVPPQESVVLSYFVAAKVPMTLVLRSAGDNELLEPPESVTLSYVIQTYRISVPTPQTFALEPAVRNLHPPILQNEQAPTIIPLPDGKYICAGVNCP